jgi:DNA-binding HxlR family transcriptional regulator
MNVEVHDPLSSAVLPPNVFDRNCPSRRLLSTVSGKWSLLVIDALGDGPMRTGALKRRIDGISQKMLTETLRDLENLNLVNRHSKDTIPPHVEYGLTDLGLALCELVCRIDRWVEQNFDELTCASSGRGPAAARVPG